MSRKKTSSTPFPNQSRSGKTRGRPSPVSVLSNADCLCLVCRQIGHVVQSCPCFLQWLHRGRHDDATIDTKRPSPPLAFYSPTLKQSTDTICERCKQLYIALDILEGAAPQASDGTVASDREHAEDRQMVQIPPLGPVASLRLLSTCPVCRLVFNNTYLTDIDLRLIAYPEDAIGHRLVLVPGWTIHRLQGSLEWPGYWRGEGPYAKCLYTLHLYGGLSYDETRGAVDSALDAVVIADDGENAGRALGVKKVDLETPDYSMIKDWFRLCEDLHPDTCRPLVSENLKKIKLVDVETRQIVMYPPDGCDFVALSYVWGDVTQPGYQLGTILSTVPATLEDAMTVTRHLGKRYLWVDSLCIDQDNKEEKQVQIPLMSAIYTGAWATIFNLAGQSARSGLPRVGTLEGVIPQRCFNIGGKRLLSTMPTLSQQISRSVWATRAWTFQEGTLSPRRLFFTHHQVYFECNSVQCCESLDHTNSPFHLSSNDQRRASIDTVAREYYQADDDEPEDFRLVFGNGVLRDPFLLLSRPEGTEHADTLQQYGNLVSSYTSRKMTNDADSLNAFSALLTRLTETHYQSGFVQGLPVERLPKALLWRHYDRPRRRDGFPAWSWAGWEGAVSIFEFIAQKEDLPPLRAWVAGDGGQPRLIYEFDPTPWRAAVVKAPESADTDNGDVGDHIEDQSWSDEDTDESGTEASTEWEDADEEEIDHNRDPVLLLAKTMFEDSPGVLLPSVDHDDLLIEAIGLTLKLPTSFKDRPEMKQAECWVKLKDVSERQCLNFQGYNAGDLARERGGKKQEFILLSRRLMGIRNMSYAVLLVDREGVVASRVAVGELHLEDFEFLAGANPRIQVYKLR